MNPGRADSHVWLHQVGVICAAGSGLRALDAVLSPERPAALPLLSPFWPASLPQGLVTDPLPSLQEFPQEFQTRCNAIVLACFAQIADSVRAAIARVGAAKVAIVLGTSTSGIGEAQRAFAQQAADGALPAEFRLAQQALGGPSEFLRLISGARGPGYTISTACTSSAKALASGARLLRTGLADVVIAGGADALNRFTLSGFSALECLSLKACNPMSLNRDGINIGEGAALFLMSRDAADVTLAGWGESSDAHHFSAPDPNGTGALQAMREALAMAGADAPDIDYINLHGTATIQNDAMESLAVATLFGLDTPCSSTKPITGHTLGAAGAIEAAICWQLLKRSGAGTLPPHWWDQQSDPALPALRLVVPGERPVRPPRRVLSNSFAFGGSNASLILERTGDN